VLSTDRPEKRPAARGKHEQLHVDRGVPTVRLLDNASRPGVDGYEKEANLFAAELLMPARFLERDLGGRETLDPVRRRLHSLLG
jgi:Zn-dependent peptidase ImmA (M78 family)